LPLSYRPKRKHKLGIAYSVYPKNVMIHHLDMSFQTHMTGVLGVWQNDSLKASLTFILLHVSEQ